MDSGFPKVLHCETEWIDCRIVSFPRFDSMKILGKWRRLHRAPSMTFTPNEADNHLNWLSSSPLFSFALGSFSVLIWVELLDDTLKFSFTPRLTLELHLKTDENNLLQGP